MKSKRGAVRLPWLSKEQNEWRRFPPVEGMVIMTLLAVELGEGYIRIGPRTAHKVRPCWLCRTPIGKGGYCANVADRVDSGASDNNAVICRPCWEKFWPACLSWQRRNKAKFEIHKKGSRSRLSEESRELNKKSMEFRARPAGCAYINEHHDSDGGLLLFIICTCGHLNYVDGCMSPFARGLTCPSCGRYWSYCVGEGNDWFLADW